MLELAVVAVLLVANGVFAMAEIALVAARRVRLEQHAATGNTAAAAALAIKADPTNFLSTVQVGITLIGIFAGAYSGTAFADPVAGVLRGAPWLAPYADALALTLVVSLLTFASLIVGELVPKAIALRNPERVAASVARPFALVAALTSPLVRLLSATTTGVLWVMRLPPVKEGHVTEEEIRALILQATHAGEVLPAERAIVEAVFRLGDRRVSTLMTPRFDIDWVDLRALPAALVQATTGARHSRLLLCDGSLDAVVGLVRAEDLLAHQATSPAWGADDLRALARPVGFVPETLPALALLDRFRGARTHTLLVVDEFGAVQGLVTLSDVLSALLGSIPDTVDPEPATIVRREDGSYLVDGDTPLEDLRQTVALPAPADGVPPPYTTLAGLVMTHLARVPVPGDVVDWSGWRFEVMDMDGRRVDKVLIAPSRDFR